MVPMEWPAQTLPRGFDVALAAVALVLLGPVLLAIGLAVVLTSGRPMLYGQTRLGRNGVPFRIHKFRTLEVGSDEDDTVAPDGDPRTTPVGGWLRRSRLDELPQLWDVLRGRMALVGPRPETAANLAGVDAQALERRLSVRPGLTGATQLALIAEDELLADEANPTQIYREVLVPAKVRNDIAWLKTRTRAGDLALLLRTPMVLASPGLRMQSRRRVSALLRGAVG